MGRAPRVTAGDVIRVIEKLGYVQVRASGSHRIFRSDSGKRTTVPYHGSEILHPKTFASILKDLELSAAEFEKHLRDL